VALERLEVTATGIHVVTRWVEWDAAVEIINQKET
jgi:hypothetical protein